MLRHSDFSERSCIFNDRISEAGNAVGSVYAFVSSESSDLELLRVGRS